MPKISVIVPVYKVEPYLNRCIDSILNQTFTDFELILVDDGSPDNCGKICDEYAAKDASVVVIHKENGGLSSARNAGLDWSFENSDSEWITFIDSDDWVHKQYLEILYTSIISSEQSISICKYRRVNVFAQDETEDGKQEIIYPTEFWLKDRTNAVVAWGKLYKKELWRSIRFPVGRLHEDEFTTYKLLFNQKNLCMIRNELYYYFVNNASIVHSSLSFKRVFDLTSAMGNQIRFFELNCTRDFFQQSLINYLYEIATVIKILSPKKNVKKQLKFSRKLLHKEMRKYHRKVKLPLTGIYCAQIYLKDNDIKKAELSKKIKFFYYYIREKGLRFTIYKVFKKIFGA